MKRVCYKFVVTKYLNNLDQDNGKRALKERLSKPKTPKIRRLKAWDDSPLHRKIASGLLKLLFPDKSFSREELRRVIEVAVEYRQRVRDWLHKVDPGEFPKEKLIVTVRD